MTRAVALAALLLAGPALAGTPPAAKPPVNHLPGEPVDLRAVDGWTIRARFSVGTPGKPTLVLLHGTGQRKEDWKRLAFPLSRAGYGVLAVDLRGHGESRLSPSGEELTWKKLRATRVANDYADMSRDAEAAVAWLAGQGVPEESIGFIGAEVGGSIALRYAATHPKTPFVALLSPGMAWQEVLTVNALRALKGRPVPVLMVHSEADKRSAKETPILYAFAKASVGERLATLIVVPQERGTRMFKAQRSLVARVLDWIANPVKPEPLPDAPEASTEAVPAPPSAESEAAMDPSDDEE
jgi:alpha-beta hydrolase superfamily lysophospholipase